MPASHRLHAGDSKREMGLPASGSTQTSVHAITMTRSMLRGTFVMSLTSGEPSVFEYIVGAGTLSSTHFLWDKLMDQFVFF